MFPFLLLGVFGVRMDIVHTASYSVLMFSSFFQGVYGAIFSKLNIRWSREVRSKTWMKTHPVLEVLLVSLSGAIFYRRALNCDPRSPS